MFFSVVRLSMIFIVCVLMKCSLTCDHLCSRPFYRHQSSRYCSTQHKVAKQMSKLMIKKYTTDLKHLLLKLSKLLQSLPTKHDCREMEYLYVPHPDRQKAGATDIASYLKDIFSWVCGYKHKWVMQDVVDGVHILIA